jgi:hypothetical protein
MGNIRHGRDKRSFCHFVDTNENRLRSIQAERIDCLGIDNEIELYRPLHGYVGWLRSTQKIL